MGMAVPDDSASFDYSATRAAFRWEVPPFHNFAVDTVGGWARESDKLAMLHLDSQGESRRITFAEFAERSDRLAAALRARGIGPGDRVLIVLPRVPEWWEAILAVMKLGAVSLPGTTLLTARDLAYRIASSEAKAIVTDAELAPRVEQAAEHCPTLALTVVVGAPRQGWLVFDALVAEEHEPFIPHPTRSDDPCMLYFTSGTTAHPKMVLHSHASYPIGHQVTGRYWLALDEQDLHWNYSDNGWAKAAWSSLFGPWITGAALFVQDARGRFDPASVLQMLQEYPITSFCAAPTVYRMLVLQDLTRFSPMALRSCVGAGEPLNPEVIEVWRDATGMTIRDGYGQTETVLLVGNFPGIEVRPGSMGKPTPGFDVAIVDDDGSVVPPGSEGHIGVRIRPMRPVGFFHGYWKDPAATARAQVGDYYLTGDRATMDADGYFWFVGRADDVIISAGYRISPFEIESALLEHPAVAESAVVGSPDPIRGQIVKAFVVLAPGREPSDALSDEIVRFVQELTEPYAHPRALEFVSELPKTISGKIRRVELREHEQEQEQEQEQRQP